MSNRPRPSQPPERRQLTRRQIEAHQREANVQRRVIFALAGAVGIALLLIIGGFVVDRFVTPNRTLKRVNDVALTRSEYDRLARVNQLQQMARTLQFSKLFGSNQSFGQGGRFDEQIVEANVQLDELGSARARQQPVDETLINEWADQQIAAQYAKEQFQIDPQQGEIDQLLVGELASVLDSEGSGSNTDVVSETVTAEPAAATAAATPAATAEATGAAATTTTTAAPTATPQPAEATTKADQIIDVLYTEYLNILSALPEEAQARQSTPHASKEELAAALRGQYRTQLIQQRVGEALVKEIPADDASTPEQISARHILLKVPRPTPTPEADEASATETATADETPTPEPTPTPAPTPSAEELEAQFAERKAEADTIYQQLIAKPETFADIARELSEDEGSAEQGGDVGTFDRQGQTQTGQSLVQPFVEAAWALEENAISEPVRSEFGWHIIQRLPEDPEAKLRRLRQQAYDKWLAEQRQKATIVPAPTATPTVPPPVEPEAPATSTAEATTTP